MITTICMVSTEYFEFERERERGLAPVFFKVYCSVVYHYMYLGNKIISNREI